MRIGILEFGGDGGGTFTTVLVAGLRERDVDVVQAERIPRTLAEAGEEASRLQRADCDSVVFFVNQTESDASRLIPRFVGHAGLLIACPLFLVSDSPLSLPDCAGSIAEVGLEFQPWLVTDDDTLSEIADFILEETKKRDKLTRQQGQEAAAKLYGQRMAVSASNLTVFDPVQWRRQFGVTIVPEGEEADFSAPDGDVNAALTRQLLQLLAGENTQVETVDYTELKEEVEEKGERATFAQIARRNGRYTCLYSEIYRHDNQWCWHYPTKISNVFLAGRLLSSRIQCIVGDYSNILRYACIALDIEPEQF